MPRLRKSDSKSFVTFPSAIPQQFIIANAQDPALTEDHPLRAGWDRHDLGAVHLLASPDVRIVRCDLADGSLAGVFIGEPIDVAARRSVQGGVILPAPKSIDEIDAWVEEQIYRFSGTYLFVLAFAGVSRVYLDADGFMPLVYDPARRVAGSTAAAVYRRDDYLQKFDAELFDQLNILGGGSFPAGLTAHSGLKRLLCNFYLDLQAWTVRRHWPNGEFSHSPHPEQAARELGQAIRAGVDSYLQSGPSCIALTGGNETRLLLSLLTDSAQSLQFVCFRDAATARDCTIAERLARRFGLNLRYLRFPPVTDDEANEWMARIGYCAGEHRYRSKAGEALRGYRYFIGGLGGEIGRGFLWRPTDGDEPVSPTDIYKRLMLPPCPPAEKAVAEWFETVPAGHPLFLLDIAYLELRMCCWAAVQAYGTIGPHVHPMVSREIFTRMMELPPSWRRKSRWMRFLIEDSWPELLSIPINSLGSFREAVRSAKRVMRQPSLLARRWRKRYA
jgi:hypothetical protein